MDIFDTLEVFWGSFLCVLGLEWELWVSEDILISVPGLEAHWELDAASQKLEMEMYFLTFQEIPSNSGHLSSGQ